MKTDAVILACNGRSSIYKKNNILLRSKPLVEYTMEAAIKSKQVCGIFILTNDEETMEKSKDYKKISFISIPKSLCEEDITVKNSLLYLTKTTDLSHTDLLAFLSSSCPLRTYKHIDDAINFAKTLHSFDSVAGVTQRRILPAGGLLLDKNKKTKIFNKNIKPSQSSDRGMLIYTLNNAIFIIPPKKIHKLNKYLISDNSYGFEMEYFESINVDTPYDIAVAEAALKYQEERFDWNVRGGFNLQRLYIHDDPKMGIERNILDATTYERHFQRYKFFLKHIEPSDSVLDIACGSGYGSEILAAKARFVHGVDSDSVTIDYAKCHHMHPNIKFDASPIESFVPAEQYNKIISVETIEHLADPDQFLACAKKWLRHNGMLWLTCPLFEKAQKTQNPFHISNITYKKLNTLMKRYFNKICFFNLEGKDIFSADSLNNPTTYIVAKGTRK